MKVCNADEIDFHKDTSARLVREHSGLHPSLHRQAPELAPAAPVQGLW